MAQAAAARAGASLRKTSRKSLRNTWGKSAWIGLAFVAPAVAFSLVFDWYPMLEGMYRSLFSWDGFGKPLFVGLRNFADIFRDEVFWIAVKNMLFFLAANLVLMFPTIIACVVLFRIRSGRAQFVYRVLFCIPMVVPYMVVILMWKFMYNPQYGVFNNLLALLDLKELQRTWLGDPRLVKWCIVFMGFPFVTTNAALIYLGGLKSISESVWEAAMLDGCGPVRKFVSLEFPLIAGQFKLNLIGAISGAITGYGLQMILTKGGPGHSSLVPGLYMYNQAFSAKRFGFASAIGMVLFLVSLLVTLLTMRFVKGQEDIK